MWAKPSGSREIRDVVFSSILGYHLVVHLWYSVGGCPHMCVFMCVCVQVL